MTVIVRAATPADAGAIATIYGPVITDTAMSFEESPPDPAEIRRRMLVPPRLPWLVAQQSNRIAGYAYASPHRSRPAYRWSLDCSIYLDLGFRSMGLGRLLYERLTTELAELGYVSLFAGIALPNPVSVRFHEVMGFEAVGVFRKVGYKLGAWRDVGWWQRTLTDLPEQPSEPAEWRPR
ncbi:MAG: GNAT family N-acetyltransferase [Nocardioidaceae bacterium]